MQTATYIPLRRKAQQIADQRQAENDRRDREYAESRKESDMNALVNEVRRLVGDDYELVPNADEQTVTVEGITFTFSDADGFAHNLVVVGKCLKCGERIFASYGRIVHLFELPEHLERLEKNAAAHKCPDQQEREAEARENVRKVLPKPPTLAEQLEQLIRDIVREEITPDE